MDRHGAPRRYRGDLGRIAVEPMADEAATAGDRFVSSSIAFRISCGTGLGRVLDAPWDVVHCWEEPYILAGAQVARHTPSRRRLVIASFQNLAKQYPWPFSAFERATMTRADGWIAFGQTVHETLAVARGYAGQAVRA